MTYTQARTHPHTHTQAQENRHRGTQATQAKHTYTYAHEHAYTHKSDDDTAVFPVEPGRQNICARMCVTFLVIIVASFVTHTPARHAAHMY